MIKLFVYATHVGKAEGIVTEGYQIIMHLLNALLELTRFALASSMLQCVIN